MSTVVVGRENTSDVEIYYEDMGSGQPVLLSHGWPLNGASWERQTAALLDAGFRVITYDRRGFGKSSQPSGPYDYDTFASDVDVLIRHLDLQNFDFAGFSMGSAEVTRYIGKFGTSRIRKAVLLGVLPPFLLKTEDNPNGADRAGFEGFKAGIRHDRYAFVAGFLQNFYSLDKLLGSRISEEAVRNSWNVAALASARALHDCVDAWIEDFRPDIAKFDIPTLLIHGDDDRILPIDGTARAFKQMLPSAEIVELPGAPHGLLWTHADEVNAAVLEFLKA